MYNDLAWKMWKTLGKRMASDVTLVENKKGYPLDNNYLKAFQQGGQKSSCK